LIHRQQSLKDWVWPLYKGRIKDAVRAPPAKNIFTPQNDFARGKFYWINVPEMAEYTGAQPLLIEQTFGMSIRSWELLLIVDGGLIEAEKLAEQGMPIGRYPGITLRNAHLQYIVTWYSLL
jgi:surfeit locus 1 family protein